MYERMKNKLFVIVLFALLTNSCIEDEMVKGNSSSLKERVFTASFEQNESRTYIEEGNLLRWTKGDQISLFEGSTLSRQYKFDGETGDNAGTFSIVTAPYGSGNELGCNYAVYPYDSGIKISDNGVLTTTLPAMQNYAENSFGLGANTMVAVTQNADDTFLKFMNVGGYLKLQLYGDDVVVKSITLTGNSHEKLAGQATLTSVYGQAPTVNMVDEATESVTLDCGEGITIGTTAETATAFWMVLPPTTFENGFTISVVNGNNETITQSTSNRIVVERNVVKPMEAYELESISWLNPNQYITYVENYEIVYPNESDMYEYSSNINNPIDKIGKIELKYKMQESSKSIYLCCTNFAKDDYSCITMNQYGLNFCIDDYNNGVDKYDDYTYTWNELGVAKTDCMTLITSFKDGYIQINGVSIDYKMIGYPCFESDYLFSYYFSEYDEGRWTKYGKGVPEGSKLYYVKIWDENDKLVYIGGASKALNPKTNEEEYCWRSYYNDEDHYEFAYYPKNITYNPYGGGVD